MGTLLMAAACVAGLAFHAGSAPPACVVCARTRAAQSAAAAAATRRARAPTRLAQAGGERQQPPEAHDGRTGAFRSRKVRPSRWPARDTLPLACRRFCGAAMEPYLALAAPLAPYMAGWTAAFFLARYAFFPLHSADFGNRVISIVHALAAIALAVPALDWDAPLASVGQANTAAQARRRRRRRRRETLPFLPPLTRAPRQTLCMSVSLAYFVYDFFCCLVIDPEPVGIIHHLCTTAGLAVGLAHGKARVCGGAAGMRARASPRRALTHAPCARAVRHGAGGVPAADGGVQPVDAPQPAAQGGGQERHHRGRHQPGA